MTQNANSAAKLAGGYFGLQAQVALVTGASAGLGRHFAKHLAEAGAIVGLAARRQDKLVELAAEIEGAGGRAIAIAMDVTDRESIEAGFARLESEIGPASILVNNAGIAGTHNFLDAPDSETDLVFDTNLRAAWRVGQRAAQGMARAGIEGSIINIASILGLGVIAGAASYCASKAAVIHLTKAMALELVRHHIRVNALAPGFFPTDMTEDYLASEHGRAMIAGLPMRRVGRPEELDGALLLLASARSSYITGSVITVDGGHLLTMA